MMLRHRVGAVCLAVLALFAFPREGSAHILDIIWEMTGPQMIGVVFGCDYDLQTKEIDCRALDKLIGKPAPDSPPRPRMWLSLDGAVYTSTGKDSDIREYEAFETYMLAFEPMLAVRSYENGAFSLHHGVFGLSYDFLFGTAFSRFDKLGLKFTPIGFRYKRFSFAYNLRLYPNGFTDDEFGFGPRLHDLNRPRETLNGFSVGYRW